MAEQKIELRKIRDFSENISDTLVFIKQNFKPLLSSFLGVAGIFMLANAIIGGIYQSQYSDLFKEILNPGDGNLSTVSMFGFKYLLVLVFTLLNMIAMQVTITGYMKVYNLKQSTPSIEEVWNEFKKYYLKVLIYSIPVYLVIILSFFFCIAPFFYFAVVFMPFPIILMVEDESFGGAWSRCFTIIKENFWVSFGIYIVVYIIYTFAASIIAGIMGLIGGLLSYFTTKDIGTTIGVVTSILSICTYVFYIVFFVSAILHYYSLVEKYDAPGMMQRLEKLGEHGDDHTNVEEQY